MMKDVKKIVREIQSLCRENNFKRAGEIARSNKKAFIDAIAKGNNDDMLYAYRVCSYFNMRQTDCFNLRF